MPFAEDYDAAAQLLSGAAETTATLLDGVRGTLSGGVMVGGALTTQVTDGLDAAGTVFDQVAAELSELAQLCRERAEVCRQALTAQHAYTSAYTDYERDLRDWSDGGGRHPQPVAPTPPDPPPSWVNH